MNERGDDLVCSEHLPSLRDSLDSNSPTTSTSAAATTQTNSIPVTPNEQTPPYTPPYSPTPDRTPPDSPKSERKGTIR